MDGGSLSREAPLLEGGDTQSTTRVMGGYGWFLGVMGGYVWVWMVMGGYWWLWGVTGGYGWLWVVMGGYGWLWVGGPKFNELVLISGLICLDLSQI